VGDIELCAEIREKFESSVIRNERKILPSLKALTMNTAPVRTSSRAIISQVL